MNNDYQKRKETYDVYSDFLFKEINLAANAFIMGTEVSNTLPMWNMMFLLLQLRNEDYASCRPTQEEIDCMSRFMYCAGVDTSKMEEIWPAIYPKDEEVISDGIGYMVIENDDPEYSTNRIL